MNVQPWIRFNAISVITKLYSLIKMEKKEINKLLEMNYIVMIMFVSFLEKKKNSLLNHNYI
jgi:hypothetical protein